MSSLATQDFKANHYFKPIDLEKKPLCTFDRIIRDFSQINGVKLEGASSDWLMQLAGRPIYALDIGLNSSTTAKSCVDKSATSSFLGQIPHVEHVVFRKLKNAQSIPKDLVDHAKSYNFNVVCKPLKGGGGRNVFHTSSLSELELKATELYRAARSICVCPFYEIANEYRIILLNGQPELIYRKIRPTIVGDGKKTVKELMEESNLNPANFKDLQHATDLVPEAGQKLLLTWKHDQNEGASSEFIPLPKQDEDSLATHLVNLATSASTAVRLKFGTIDLIELADHTLKVLEVNSTVGVDHIVEQHGEEGYKKIYAIYEKALNQLLEVG